MGSSPLTRGKHWRRAVQFSRRGLIPAHAGKTSLEGEAIPRKLAHPRSRGENSVSRPPSSPPPGSSPLTRGKRIPQDGIVSEQRLIPAHAGKTHKRPAPRRARRAHPRSRGENISGLFIDAAAKGSSPLTRGKPLTAILPRGTVGLIPAHAGKTDARRRRRRRVGAHPRSRGENTS